MNRINEGTYSTPHNYGQFTELINDFINKLYGNSLIFYSRRYDRNNPTGTPNIDITKIEDSLGYIDDYLYYYYQFNSNEFISILSNLINNLYFVTVLPPSRRGFYGEFVESEKTIYINPELPLSTNLSGDERTRLYICHELGHIQNSVWMKKLLPHINSLNCSIDDKQLIYDGFSLIDEATTQDRAETITYYYSSKIRPFMSRKVSRLFNGRPFETNFDYYGEFQVPTISFAKTLRGIGKLNNDDSVMEEFNKRSLNEEFTNRIFDEYIMDGQLDNLIYMMKRLGTIKNASYASFGLANPTYLDQSLEALDEYNKKVKTMRDYREPRGIN